jgi:GTPase
VLLHVVDASHPDWEGQMRVVDKVLAELNLADRPTIAAFNKMDAVTDPAAFTARARELYPDAVMATTMRTDGLNALKAALRSRNRIDRPTVAVRLPLSAGARAASLYRLGEVVSREENGEGYALVVRLDRWQIERLKAEGVDVDDAAPATRQRATG